MRIPDTGTFPWWYLAKQSAVLNNLCLVLGGHLNKHMVSPLTALQRDNITTKALEDAYQFLGSCLFAITDPGLADDEARYDLFLAAKVLFHQQKKLGIQLDEHDEQGYKKEFEQYRQLLEKIISYDPDENQIFTDDEVLHLLKCFDALMHSIHISISAQHRLLMKRGRSR